jgi:hypothetical protein
VKNRQDRKSEASLLQPNIVGTDLSLERRSLTTNLDETKSRKQPVMFIF